MPSIGHLVAAALLVWLLKDVAVESTRPKRQALSSFYYSSPYYASPQASSYPSSYQPSSSPSYYSSNPSWYQPSGYYPSSVYSYPSASSSSYYPSTYPSYYQQPAASYVPPAYQPPASYNYNYGYYPGYNQPSSSYTYPQFPSSSLANFLGLPNLLQPSSGGGGYFTSYRNGGDMRYGLFQGSPGAVSYLHCSNCGAHGGK